LRAARVRSTRAERGCFTVMTLGAGSTTSRHERLSTRAPCLEVPPTLRADGRCRGRHRTSTLRECTPLTCSSLEAYSRVSAESRRKPPQPAAVLIGEARAAHGAARP
jgi:hypothetical protein